jgi:hypothetical protein
MPGKILIVCVKKYTNHHFKNPSVIFIVTTLLENWIGAYIFLCRAYAHVCHKHTQFLLISYCRLLNLFHKDLFKTGMADFLSWFLFETILIIKSSIMKKNRMVMLAVFAFASVFLPRSLKAQGDKDQLIKDSKEVRTAFIKADESMKDRFNNAYGYVIFPDIGKGAVVVGGAGGNGVVFEKVKTHWIGLKITKLNSADRFQQLLLNQAHQLLLNTGKV